VLQRRGSWRAHSTSNTLPLKVFLVKNLAKVEGGQGKDNPRMPYFGRRSAPHFGVDGCGSVSEALADRAGKL
jgi:hypothetical protein